MTDRTSVPHCRDDPPWGECGDPNSPTYGAVFAWPAFGRACKLTYDGKGRRLALTLFDGRTLGPEILIQGRRFDVVHAGSAEIID